MTQETASTNPYPTMASKVRLLRENGIDIIDYMDNCDDELELQAVKLTSDQTVADRSVEIANQYGLWLIELSHVQEYKDGLPKGDKHWMILFGQSLP